MPKTNWINLFKDGVLDRCGESATTMRELAAAITAETGDVVSVDALFNAHKRHRDRLKLKSSLTEYFAEASQKVVKHPKIKPEDVLYTLSRKRKGRLRKAKRFIITSAVNNCLLDTSVWASIEQYAKHNDAEIIVIPVRYKNPTGWTALEENQNAMDNAWWPEEIEPYACDELIKIHPDLWVMSHVRIQATATTPLSGLDALSRDASAIFGHANLQMKMVATPQSKLPKILYTTGSCSQPFYSDTKSGIKGEFHHGMGALVVELNGSKFHMRAVVADDTGSFYDLDKYYTPTKVEKSKGALALITGDEHAIFADKRCRAATYEGEDSITAVLKPKELIRHDIFDGYSISHHNRKDPVIQYSKHKEGHNSLEWELNATKDYIESTTPKGTKNVIVASNHNDFLMRWMKSCAVPWEEPWNAELWHSLWGSVLRSVAFQERGVIHDNPFALWMGERLSGSYEFLPTDSAYSIKDVVVGMHGHHGINGSRGSVNQFAKLGVKTVIGHVHTPAIKHGSYAVGTSTSLKLDYTHGPSTWAHCHCAIYPNGKRQLIFIVNGKWRS